MNIFYNKDMKVTLIRDNSERARNLAVQSIRDLHEDAVIFDSSTGLPGISAMLDDIGTKFTVMADEESSTIWLRTARVASSTADRLVRNLKFDIYSVPNTYEPPKSCVSHSAKKHSEECVKKMTDIITTKAGNLYFLTDALMKEDFATEHSDELSGFAEILTPYHSVQTNHLVD